MARFMKCLSYNRQWKNALHDLIQSSVGQSHMEMGVIAKQESREAEFHKGHGLLDRLEDACLLESIDGGSAVKMHHLIRHMAVKIYQERRSVMIKAGAKLKNLSGAREWEESLVTASLIENQIKKIPSKHSPRCPSLSTLLLPYNRELELIDDTFFNQLHGLKILDLSHTIILLTLHKNKINKTWKLNQNVGNWIPLREQSPLNYEKRNINAISKNPHQSKLKFSA
uniref:NB-ARC domain-containing protein n=1 Tax=Salix viminalis TaxID=40686 RepID=A0A6N2L0I3_SALVM